MRQIGSGWRIVIHSSRYSGVYEGGRWFAMYLSDEFPEDSISDDVSCATFFGKFMDMIGVGNTPQDALNDLLKKDKEAKDFHERYMQNEIGGKSWAKKLKRSVTRSITRAFQ
jgi:hypothetical protein